MYRTMYDQWTDRLDELGPWQIVAAALHENAAVNSILYLLVA